MNNKYLSAVRYALIGFIGVLYANQAFAFGWKEYKSDNFTMYSDANFGRPEAVLRYLENSRNAIFNLTGWKRQGKHESLKIFLVNSSRDMKALTQDENVLGFFTVTWDGPLIIASSEKDKGMDYNVMLHEYTHYLFNQNVKLALPLWYSEGFAEFVSTAKVEEDKVIFGRVSNYRRGVTYLSVADTLTPMMDEKNAHYWNNYYTSAWKLMHFVYLGPLHGYENYNAKIPEYIKRYNSGESAATAFSKSLGKDIAEIENEIEEYATKPLWTYTTDIQPYTKPIESRKVDSNDFLFELAEVAYFNGRHEYSLKLLKKISINKRLSAWRKGVALRAFLKTKFGGRPEKNEIIEKIESAVDNDAQTYAYLSKYYLKLYSSSSEKSDKSSLEKAIKFGSLATQKNPEVVSGQNAYWEALAANRQYSAALDAMMFSYGSQPDNLIINEAIAEFFMSVHEYEQALPFLRRAELWNHDPKRKAFFRNIILSIKNSQVGKINLPKFNFN